MGKTRKQFLLVIVLLILLICSPAILNVLGSTSTYLPKSGRVLDATTNKGMENVFVIATADYSNPGLLTAGGEGRLYRIFTRTDANGDYRIPSTWGKAHLWFQPGKASSTDWQITVFKPGYVTAGDEVALSSFDKYGRPEHFPHSVYGRSSKMGGFGEIRVDPFVMQPVKLGLKEAAVYYDAVVGSVREASLEEYALRKLGAGVLLPQVCGLDSFAEFDLTTFRALRNFSANPVAMDMRIKELEPQNWAKDDSTSPKYLAGDVCDAMKGAADTR